MIYTIDLSPQTTGLLRLISNLEVNLNVGMLR